MESLAHKKFSPETHKKMRWVTKMYHQWRVDRNKNPEFLHIFADLDDISTLNKSFLSYGLCWFITEVKKINGSDFPPKTIYEMIVCVQMHLESKGLFWKLLDDKEDDFMKLCYTCDNIMKERASGRLGSVIHQVEVISYDDENFLWENGFLGCENPEQLVRTVLFQVGLNCTLHAGSEHKNLCSIGFNSQFRYMFKDGVRHVVYNEDLGTKTNKGGL